MNKHIYAVAAAVLVLSSSDAAEEQSGSLTMMNHETLELFDSARNRAVPVVIYSDLAAQGAKLKPAIISHGYGGKNTDYRFLAEHLAKRGYYVASIQHDVPGDEPLPKTGKPYEVRMPSWKRGVENILFVLAEVRKSQPELRFDQLLVVGHSQGGDMSMLLTRDHPELVHAVISLDNRRMPFPRTKQPRILSIRSSDQPADEGVIPSPEEQAQLGITIVKLPATKHDDMWDRATDAQKGEILRHIDAFLGLGD